MPIRKLRISIVGCGAIGGTLARALGQGKVPGARLVALCDQNQDRAKALAHDIPGRIKVLEAAALAPGCDLLVEAAGMNAVYAVAQSALRHRRDMVILSVGALVKHPRLAAQFQRRGCFLHFPSGAITGLDALKAAALGGGLQRVMLTTRKPPAGLQGAPYLQRRRISLSGLKKPLTVFTGSARQAILAFPANVNVAVAVALAGLGPDRTRVAVVADPHIRSNQHVLEFSGSFGSVRTQTDNVPSPENPKTSFLAALSALALIRGLVQGSRQGT